MKFKILRPGQARHIHQEAIIIVQSNTMQRDRMREDQQAQEANKEAEPEVTVLPEITIGAARGAAEAHHTEGRFGTTMGIARFTTAITGLLRTSLNLMNCISNSSIQGNSLMIKITVPCRI